MNPIYLAFMGTFGGLFAVVLVVLSLPYLAPFAGSASSGVVSTGSQLTNILPYIGSIVIGGIALLAIQGRKH